MPSTVRVRIAVAVDEEGQYSAIGWTRMKDDERHNVADGLDGDIRWFWLEADLPRPVIETRTAQEVVEISEPHS